jgi:VanZ family protein
VLKNNTFLVLAILWTVLITYLSIATIDNVANQIKIENKDKIAHFVFYFLFVFLWFKANYDKNTPIKNSIYILIAGIIYGILMELSQKYFTTNRTPDFFDALANSVGATVGYFAVKKYYNNKH